MPRKIRIGDYNIKPVAKIVDEDGKEIEKFRTKATAIMMLPYYKRRTGRNRLRVEDIENE